MDTGNNIINNTNNNINNKTMQQMFQTPNPLNTPIHKYTSTPNDLTAQQMLLMELPTRNVVNLESSSNNINNTSNINNNNVSNESGRISVKDIRRSAACLLCRNRKRKCDGNDPCGYCVSKGMVCQYTQQKKRGPQKKSAVSSPSGGGDQLALQASPSSYENNILDRIEAQNFGSLYLKYVNLILPMTSADKMMNPTTNAHKVQSYSAMAYSARICGDHSKSTRYISQARLLAGSIYDSMDADSIAALLMMSNYWQLTLDIPLSIHYSKLAYSLCRLLPADSLEYRIQMVCSVGNILCDENTSNKKKSKQLMNVSKAILDAAPTHRYTPLMSAFMSLCAIIIRVLNYNPMFITTIDSTTKFFTTFSHITLSEEDRTEILKEVNNVNIATTLLGVQPQGIEEHLRVITSIFTPMYMAVIEWRSGHVTEALSHAISCLQGLQILQDKEIFGYACGVADFPHVVMIGALCQFLYEQEQYFIAAQMCEKIRLVCKLLSPELDFVMKYTDEFMERLPPNVAANFTIPPSPPRIAFSNTLHAITSDEADETYQNPPTATATAPTSATSSTKINYNVLPPTNNPTANYIMPHHKLTYDLDIHDMNTTISNTTASNINNSILNGINNSNPAQPTKFAPTYNNINITTPQNTQPINNAPQYTTYAYTPETQFNNFTPNSPSTYFNSPAQNSPLTQTYSPGTQNFNIPSPNYNTPSPSANSPNTYINTPQNYNSPNNYSSPNSQNSTDSSPAQFQDTNHTIPNDNIFTVTHYGTLPATRGMFYVTADDNYITVLDQYSTNPSPTASPATIAELHPNATDPNDPPLWT